MVARGDAGGGRALQSAVTAATLPGNLHTRGLLARLAGEAQRRENCREGVVGGRLWVGLLWVGGRVPLLWVGGWVGGTRVGTI